MSEKPSKYGIDTTMIKCVTSYDVIFSLISNMSLIRVRGIKLESLCLEIDDDIPIPRII